MSHSHPLYSILGDSISTLEGYSTSGGEYYKPHLASLSGVFTPDDTWWMQVIRRKNGTLLRNNSISGCTVSDGGILPACAPHRIRNLATDTQTPDHILVFVGLNDAILYIPLEAFAASYDLMLQRLQETFPTTTITCATLVAGYTGTIPDHRPTPLIQRIETYNNVIRNAVANHQCALADLAALGQRYASMDGFHPTKEGMMQLADLWMRAF